MKTVEMNLDMQRTEIIRQPFATDSPEVIKEVRCALSKAMENHKRNVVGIPVSGIKNFSFMAMKLEFQRNETN